MEFKNKRWIIYQIIFLCLLGANQLISAANLRQDAFYYNFWFPKYHGVRLDYCTLDGKECGLPVATRYCQRAGYAYANQELVDYEAGCTAFLQTLSQCRGWPCKGFKMIRCVAFLPHKPPKPYHYRYRRFIHPSYHHCTLAWCYNGSKGCGQRAAQSFCRQRGYLKTVRYAMQNVVSTKAIGNQKPCFGEQCRGFEYIDCYR